MPESRTWRERYKAEHAARLSTERVNRVLIARDQDYEERLAPTDLEGQAGHPALHTLRDKNFEEFRRLVDGLPRLPFRRPRPPFDYLPPLGFDGAVRFVRIEVAKFADALMLSEAHNGRIVGDRFAVRAFIWNRAPLLVWDDPIGDINREDLEAMVEGLGFAQAVPFIYASTRETEILEKEAERKGFG